MNLIHNTRRIIGVSALGLGLLAVPAVASAAPASSHVERSTVTKAAAPVTKTYEVVAGTFHTKSAADKRLSAITAKGINGLSVVKIGKTAKSTRYRIEETGLTRVAAKALWKQLHQDHFFSFFTAR